MQKKCIRTKLICAGQDLSNLMVILLLVTLQSNNIAFAGDRRATIKSLKGKVHRQPYKAKKFIVLPSPLPPPYGVHLYERDTLRIFEGGIVSIICANSIEHDDRDFQDLFEGNHSIDKYCLHAPGEFFPDYNKDNILKSGDKRESVIFQSKPNTGGVEDDFFDNSNTAKFINKRINEFNALVNSGNESPIVYRVLADLYQQSGDISKAEKYFNIAISLASKYSDRHELAISNISLAKLYLALDRTLDAQIYLHRSKIYYALLDDRKKVNQIKNRISRLERKNNSKSNIAIPLKNKDIHLSFTRSRFTPSYVSISILDDNYADLFPSNSTPFLEIYKQVRASYEFSVIQAKKNQIEKYLPPYRNRSFPIPDNSLGNSLYKDKAREIPGLGSLEKKADFSQKKPSISVPEFRNETTWWWWRGGTSRQLADALSNELSATGSFKVVERQKLGAVLDEQELAELSLVFQGTEAKTGQLTGAPQYVVLGKVISYEEGVNKKLQGANVGGINLGGIRLDGGGREKKQQAYVEIDLRVVDTTTGRVIHSRTVEGQAISKSKEGPPVGKALRAALSEASEYISCAIKDRCTTDYQVNDNDRERRSGEAAF